MKKKTKKKAASAASGTATQIVEIPSLPIAEVEFKVVGLSPLVTHPMSAKARKEMLDKKQGEKAPRGICNPVREFLESIYWIEKSQELDVVRDYSVSPESDSGFKDELEKAIDSLMGQVKSGAARCGVPAVALKNAAVRAAKQIAGLDMIDARGLFFVHGTYSEAEHMDLVPIEGPPPSMVEHVISVRSGSKDLRYRPAWSEWSCSLLVEYQADVLTPQGVINLFQRGGSVAGICEGRPQKTSLGWGRFRISA